MIKIKAIVVFLLVQVPTFVVNGMNFIIIDGKEPKNFYYNLKRLPDNKKKKAIGYLNKLYRK